MCVSQNYPKRKTNACMPAFYFGSDSREKKYEVLRGRRENTPKRHVIQLIPCETPLLIKPHFRIFLMQLFKAIEQL